MKPPKFQKPIAEMNRRKIFWSELPPELLSIIAARLNLRSDILNFRSVCQSWRNSAPLSLLSGKITILSPILPHILSFDPFPDYSTLFDEPLRLVATSVFLIRSLVDPNRQPWLCSVEEVNPGKLRLLRTLSRFVPDEYEMPENFPEQLSLSCFRVSEISRVCTLDYVPDEWYMNRRNIGGFQKVVLYLESDYNNKCESNITVDDCAVTVLHDGTLTEGSLAKIGLQDGRLSKLAYRGVKKFDDVVCFKGRVCVIDRKGRLYREENGKLEGMVNDPVGEGLGSDRKKRLVVDSSSDELYLVYRCPKYIGAAFKVYKLNEGGNKWEELRGIGDHRIIVATHNGCFFVQTKDLPTWGGNCLVFTRYVFPAYGSVNGADSEIFKDSEAFTHDVAIFHFGRDECKPMGDDCAMVLWPPPAWLSSDTQLSKCCHKDGEVEMDSLERNCPESSDIEEISSTRAFNDDAQTIPAKECPSVADIQEKKSGADSTSETSCDNAQINGISKSLEGGVTKTKFQGVDVSSDLVPTLNEIWAKHGNVLEGHPVKSNDLLAWALESMAKVVILLRSTSGRSLSNTEAEYLNSTLSDLHLMRMNVSWLVPPKRL